jgi:hypothetical protein
LYAVLHLIRLSVIPYFKQIRHRHIQNNESEHISQGNDADGNTGNKPGGIDHEGGKLGSHPAIPKVLHHEHPTTTDQNDHKPDDPSLYQKVDDPLGDEWYPGEYTVDDKVLVIPHSRYGTKVHQIYEAKPGNFLGPRKTLAEQVPENYIHKNKNDHKRQKKGDQNSHGLKKGIQKLFHQTPLVSLFCYY